MNKKVIFSLLFVPFFLFGFPHKLFAAPPPTVDVTRLTFSDQREDWPVIHNNTVCWIDPRNNGSVYCNDLKTHTEFPLFNEGQPLTDLYGLVGYDKRYIVYNRLTDANSYDVSAYDLKKKEEIRITNEAGTQLGEDFDGQTVVYLSGYGCGSLYAYDLKSKKTSLLSETACSAVRISDQIVVWPNGNKVYGYDLKSKKQFEIADGASPDIYQQNVVWLYANGSTKELHLKNLKTGKEKLLVSTDRYDISWPAISDRYVIWGKSTADHVAGVEGIDIKKGIVFEIQPQGQHQNGVIAPQIEGNVAAWMAWRTGNGDIYSAEINR